jgi:hypothetical protein
MSLILRELTLWCNESFWTDQIDLGRVMRHHAIDGDANVKNLFSVLMHDWSDPEVDVNHHFLVMKFEKFDENSQIGLFGMLCKIANDHESYSDVCVRIIKAYIRELKLVFKNDENIARNNAILLKFVNHAVIIKKSGIKVRILKQLMTILSFDDAIYEEIKLKITQVVESDVKYDSVYKKSFNNIERICNKKFFKLAFLLHECKSVIFQQMFCEFLESFKRFYGDFWKIAVKNDVEMLLDVSKYLNQLRIANFMTNTCSFEQESERQCFGMVMNEPLSEEETETLVRKASFKC